MSIYKTIKNNLRELFFSISIYLGIFIGIHELTISENYKNFIIFCVSATLIYVVEILIVFNENRQDFALLKKDIDKKYIFTNIFVLPLSIIFLSIFRSIIYQSSAYFYITGALVIFYLLVNIHKSLLEDNYNNLKTHESIDFLKLFYIFLTTNISLSLINLNYHLVFVISLFFVSIYLINLLILNKIEKRNSYKFLQSFFIGIAVTSFLLVVIKLKEFIYNIDLLSAAIGIIYFIIVSGLHHYYYKEITLKVILRYLIVLILTIIFIVFV